MKNVIKSHKKDISKHAPVFVTINVKIQSSILGETKNNCEFLWNLKHHWITGYSLSAEMKGSTFVFSQISN